MGLERLNFEMDEWSWIGGRSLFLTRIIRCELSTMFDGVKIECISFYMDSSSISLNAFY